MNLSDYRYHIPHNLRHSLGQVLIDECYDIRNLNVNDIFSYILWHPFLPYMTKSCLNRQKSFNINGDWTKYAINFKEEPFYKTFTHWLAAPTDCLITNNNSYFEDWKFINYGKNSNYDSIIVNKFKNNFDRYVEIYHDIKLNGYKEIGEYPHGSVDKFGKFYLMGGRHRLTFCKVLKLKNIKVKVIIKNE